MKIIIKNIKKNGGFVLLFAVTLSSIVLAIALGIMNVSLNEVNFGTSARNTNEAFFAADSGAECALFNDKSPSKFPTSGSALPITCFGTTLTPSGSNGNFDFTLSNLGSSNQGCTIVNVSKTGSPTTTIITSKGYNIGDSACNSTNPNRLERRVRITFASIAPPPIYPVEYLVVAGGGGGGRAVQGGGGGGGAGGFRTGTIDVNIGTDYSVVVGAGGTGASGSMQRGNSGGTSSVFGISSAGGGGGGSRIDVFDPGCNDGEGCDVQTPFQGGNGGSGGGAASGNGNASLGNIPPTSPVQGYGGGGTGNWNTASGGGAGAAGAGNTAPGGIGRTSSIALLSACPAGGTAPNCYYAGGGGGASAVGGSGGGGDGGNGNGSNATGYGSGGGGADQGNNTGGRGSNGIVIIRCPVTKNCTGGTITSVSGYTIHTFTSNGTFNAGS